MNQQFYLPQPILSMICNYCGDTLEQKRDKLWKTIQPKIYINAYSDEPQVVVYDKIRKMSLEFFVFFKDRIHHMDYEEYLSKPRTSIPIGIDDDSEYGSPCYWTTDNGNDDGRYILGEYATLGFGIDSWGVFNDNEICEY